MVDYKDIDTNEGAQAWIESTLNKLKELIQNSFSIEKVSIRDGKVEIYYVDRNRIERDGCFSLREGIEQTVLEEFEYSIRYDLENRFS